MPAKRLTIEQQRAMRRRLNDAAESLAIYLDPEDGDCAVPAAAREMSEEYPYSWVMTQIEGALVTLNNALDGS